MVTCYLHILQALTHLSGFEVHSHVVQAHAGRSDDLLNEVFGGGGEREKDNELHNDESTDVFLYALESNRLVETDRMIRSLSGQLMKAKKDLSPHNLVEVRAGSYVLSPDSALSAGKMGSLEMVLLGLACAVFFGALIAVVTVCSLRYKR